MKSKQNARWLKSGAAEGRDGELLRGFPMYQWAIVSRCQMLQNADNYAFFHFGAQGEVLLFHIFLLQSKLEEYSKIPQSNDSPWAERESNQIAYNKLTMSNYMNNKNFHKIANAFSVIKPFSRSALVGTYANTFNALHALEYFHSHNELLSSVWKRQRLLPLVIIICIFIFSVENEMTSAKCRQRLPCPLSSLLFALLSMIQKVALKAFSSSAVNAWKVWFFV